ncbi:MAG: hypothetical protein KKA28_00025 [Planctomycetes bacterium]|nr:hypothetical protein [Planctomycetota bacterium]
MVDKEGSSTEFVGRFWAEKHLEVRFSGICRANEWRGIRYSYFATDRRRLSGIHLPCYASENARQPCQPTPFLPTNSADDPDFTTRFYSELRLRTTPRDYGRGALVHL